MSNKAKQLKQIAGLIKYDKIDEEWDANKK